MCKYSEIEIFNIIIVELDSYIHSHYDVKEIIWNM